MSEKIEDRHILIDTCVLIEIFRYLDNFKVFLKTLEDANCKLCINDLVFLEFIRQGKSKQRRDDLRNFLGNNFINLPITADEIDKAKEIYPLYNFCKITKNKNQIGVVDVINVAQLIKFENNLLFITLNHDDYPLELVDRIKTGTIDVDSKIITWGIYKCNSIAYRDLVTWFETKS
jgi:hypothetical protein